MKNRGLNDPGRERYPSSRTIAHVCPCRRSVLPRTIIELHPVAGGRSDTRQPGSEPGARGCVSRSVSRTAPIDPFQTSQASWSPHRLSL